MVVLADDACHNKHAILLYEFEFSRASATINIDVSELRHCRSVPKTIRVLSKAS